MTKIIELLSKKAIYIPIVVAVLVAVLAVVLNAPNDDVWVVHDDQYSPHPDSIFYVVERKSPFGEAEKNEDSQGYQRICLLLEFTEQGANGSELYEAHSLEDAEWRRCRHYSATGKPKIVSSSIPTELRKEFGLE